MRFKQFIAEGKVKAGASVIEKGKKDSEVYKITGITPKQITIKCGDKSVKVDAETFWEKYELIKGE